jgi:hypothetical protein
MPTNRKQRGEIVNHDSPNWGPLEALVGRDLSSGFMWMFEVELRNRTRLHAYKHRDTRRYLHLARDGRCFGFEGESSYRQITQFQAINGVFDLWGDPNSEYHVVHRLTPREQAVLEFTRRHASYHLLEPGEETVLLAGPGRFDPLYETDEWGPDDDWGPGDDWAPGDTDDEPVGLDPDPPF